MPREYWIEMPVVKCISSAKYFLEYAFMFPVIVSVEGILRGGGGGYAHLRLH